MDACIYLTLPISDINLINYQQLNKDVLGEPVVKTHITICGFRMKQRSTIQEIKNNLDQVARVFPKIKVSTEDIVYNKTTKIVKLQLSSCSEKKIIEMQHKIKDKFRTNRVLEVIEMKTRPHITLFRNSEHEDIEKDLKVKKIGRLKKEINKFEIMFWDTLQNAIFSQLKNYYIYF